MCINNNFALLRFFFFDETCFTKCFVILKLTNFRSDSDCNHNWNTIPNLLLDLMILRFFSARVKCITFSSQLCTLQMICKFICKRYTVFEEFKFFYSFWDRAIGPQTQLPHPSFHKDVPKTTWAFLVKIFSRNLNLPSPIEKSECAPVLKYMQWRN